MNDYMLALQQQFFREPEYAELREEIERNRQTLNGQLDRENRRRLMKIVDTETELRDEISLASFTAGFRLACGIVAELNQQKPYSFAEEEERRISKNAERSDADGEETRQR